MSRSLVVVGSGGFGREVFDLLSTLPESFETLMCVDDKPSTYAISDMARRGVRYIGTIDEWSRIATNRHEYIIAIGDPKTRRAVAHRLNGLQAAPASPLVHPKASVATGVSLGLNTIVCAGALISTNARLGQFVHVNPGAIIGHDAVLDSFVSINPGAIVSGSVSIGSSALVGAGSTILQGLSIGADSTVGASSCVTRNVLEATVVKGVPAR